MPEFRERDRHGFAFMTNEISSERRVEVGVARIAAMMRDVEAGAAGASRSSPVRSSSTPAAAPISATSSARGYVDVLLAGNALAVHDVEQALYGTSLGVDLETGEAIEGGHRHHMRAINTICRAGGLRAGGRAGRADVRRDVRVRPPRRRVRARRQHPRRWAAARHDHGSGRGAGSLRRRRSQDVELVLVLSTMLHGIGVGNMLPSWVRVVCVDINPAVVTKLADRGSAQTIGIVTDVGLFLHQLARSLQ